MDVDKAVTIRDILQGRDSDLPDDRVANKNNRFIRLIRLYKFVKKIV